MHEENLAALEIEVGIVGRVIIVYEENLAALEIEVRCEAVEQLMVFVQDKLSELEAFGVAVIERVGGFLLSQTLCLWQAYYLSLLDLAQGAVRISLVRVFGFAKGFEKGFEMVVRFGRVGIVGQVKAAEWVEVAVTEQVIAVYSDSGFEPLFSP